MFSGRMFLQKIITLLILAAYTEGSNDPDFDTYVKYVEAYITYTDNYELPINNSYMYVADDPSSKTIDDGTFDFVIIGGGSAGSVLAGRLTEVASFKVLLLEAGGLDDKFTDVPAFAVYTPFSNFNWGYKTVPQKNACLGMIDAQCEYPRGMGLGGSHIINEAAYVRGNPTDFDRWSEMGNKGWSYNEVLRYFKKSENDATKDKLHTSKYHGYDGPMTINYTYPYSLNYVQFFEAAKMKGLNETDINGRTQLGIQRSIPITTKHNKRQTAGNTFVEPVLNRTNLKVNLNAFVTKLIIEGGVVTGVRYIKDKKIHVVRASKEVILSAGAVNSPQILMLSGIGPKDELEFHNIPVKNDLPVGKNLTDHPAFFGLFVSTNQTYPNQTLKENLKRYLKGQYPFTAALGNQHIAFLNTKSPSQNPPNIEIITANQPMSIPSQRFLNIKDETYKSISKIDPLTHFTVFMVLLKPKSRGSITLTSASPVDHPKIDPAYYSDKNNEDIQSMYDGVKFVQSIIDTPPLKSINATLVADSPACAYLRAVSDKQYWYCALRELSGPLYHPCSTTRMGVSAVDSVVDAEFRVHNMKKIRVCDAGAIPEITAGHLLAPVMMMAEKLADILKGEYAGVQGTCGF